MAKTEVILTQNIVGLGGESDNVRVAAGYARNFFIRSAWLCPLPRPISANSRRSSSAAPNGKRMNSTP